MISCLSHNPHKVMMFHVNFCHMEPSAVNRVVAEVDKLVGMLVDRIYHNSSIYFSYIA